mmetsp:Transcript_62475/g.141250  ORF Transcript_62475/g.141250 Transcript_62475/m.141250 type:complete len:217 (+) Transcript_62475:826-1476(+)
MSAGVFLVADPYPNVRAGAANLADLAKMPPPPPPPRRQASAEKDVTARNTGNATPVCAGALDLSALFRGLPQPDDTTKPRQETWGIREESREEEAKDSHSDGVSTLTDESYEVSFPLPDASGQPWSSPVDAGEWPTSPFAALQIAMEPKFRPPSDYPEGSATGCIGTLRYMAPEVLLEKCYGRPADVFSFALVAWEITHGEKPFRTIIWSLRNLCF